MKLEKFVTSVKEVLDLDDFKINKKKKSVKQLLKKLENRKLKLEEKTKDKNVKKEKLEELELINFQIKKGKKLLSKLEKKNS